MFFNPLEFTFFLPLLQGTSVPHYDMSEVNENYQCLEGIHLPKDSSEEVTKKNCPLDQRITI